MDVEVEVAAMAMDYPFKMNSWLLNSFWGFGLANFQWLRGVDVADFRLVFGTKF